MHNPSTATRRATVQNIEKPVSILAPTAPGTQAPARTQQILNQHLQEWLVNTVGPASPVATVPYRFYLEAVGDRLDKSQSWVTQQIALEFGGEI